MKVLDHLMKTIVGVRVRLLNVPGHYPWTVSLMTNSSVNMVVI
ncbi:hypothetical protein Pint_30960 [Pistacia integerrima]|uniref:Uncharacterized protein n=1 Tax=Pistacia integerrima TaxID=434235 RepID=A0ACC0XQZ2_9ROSI|nr:hypothetical protein Pint_30960 [Pistacia integerrima]